ncbi:MAG: exodeoxyribonuclease VII small subunit [Bacteroidales bacterium]
MAKKQTYTDAMNELENIVSKLQNEEVEIDELKALVTRSTELLNQCKKTLHETDQEIQKIIENLD